MWSGNGEHRFRAASVRRRRRAAWLLGNLHRKQQAENEGGEDGQGEGKVDTGLHDRQSKDCVSRSPNLKPGGQGDWCLLLVG
jgi:hypothetical protein